MTLDLQAGPGLDGEVHLVVRGPTRLEGELVPSYSRDEKVALDALQAQQGALEVRWQQRPGGLATMSWKTGCHTQAPTGLHGAA